MTTESHLQVSLMAYFVGLCTLVLASQKHDECMKMQGVVLFVTI